MTYSLIRPNQTIIFFVLLILINISPLITNLVTVPIQLIITSSACVYIGCNMASKIHKFKKPNINKIKKPSNQQPLNNIAALRFPIIASAILLLLYLISKYISKNILNNIISLIFSGYALIIISNFLIQFFEFSDESNKIIYEYTPPKWLHHLEFKISKASLLINIILLIPIAFYYFTKHWIFNNILSIFFSIIAIRDMNLGNFKVGFLLLWLLFFYDIFWVYGTNVMVTVAQNIDIPIKILFPYYSNQGQWKFSMLGLGDIVLPGIFVSTCLKYDIDKSIKNKINHINEFQLSYFNTCFISYVLGIIITYVVMKVFNHAQPALIFLVPMCTLSIVLRSLWLNEFNEIKEYQPNSSLSNKKVYKNLENSTSCV